MSCTAIEWEKSSGEFMVTVRGLPAQYTWQDSKDLFRPAANHGFWVKIEACAHSQIDGQGTITRARTTYNEDAVKLYEHLTYPNTFEGRKLEVHLWDTSESSPEFIKCNCESQWNGHPAESQVARVFGASILRIKASSSRTTPPAGPYRALPTSPVSVGSRMYSGYPTQKMFPLLNADEDQLSPQLDALRLGPGVVGKMAPSSRSNLLPPSNQPQRSATGAYLLYATNSNGAPVNTSRGFVVTEPKSIFISGIDYKFSEDDVVALFSQVGQITGRCLQRDSHHKSKGSATIQYRSSEDAYKAIKEFNGYRFGCMKLYVRLDKSQPPRAAQAGSRQPAGGSGPVIVNGSILEPVQKRAR